MATYYSIIANGEEVTYKSATRFTNARVTLKAFDISYAAYRYDIDRKNNRFHEYSWNDKNFLWDIVALDNSMTIGFCAKFGLKY